MGVESVFVTLHVGLDTFRPVEEERPEEHRMHTEFCRLPPEAAEPDQPRPERKGGG